MSDFLDSDLEELLIQKDGLLKSEETGKIVNAIPIGPRKTFTELPGRSFPEPLEVPTGADAYVLFNEEKKIKKKIDNYPGLTTTYTTTYTPIQFYKKLTV